MHVVRRLLNKSSPFKQEIHKKWSPSFFSDRTEKLSSLTQYNSCPGNIVLGMECTLSTSSSWKDVEWVVEKKKSVKEQEIWATQVTQQRKRTSASRHGDTSRSRPLCHHISFRTTYFSGMKLAENMGNDKFIISWLSIEGGGVPVATYCDSYTRTCVVSSWKLSCIRTYKVSQIEIILSLVASFNSGVITTYTTVEIYGSQLFSTRARPRVPN